MRVFITGATGLVGSHVAEQLRERGTGVVALVRRSSNRAFLERLGCTLVEGDMAQPVAQLAQHMLGCDAMVHAAALVGARTDAGTYDRVNVLGTRNVFDAARLAGVRRAVHVSSVAVYGGLVDPPVTEERWLEREVPKRAAYAASKRAAERIAVAAGSPPTATDPPPRAGSPPDATPRPAANSPQAVGPLTVARVRPCVIYGERDRHLGPRLDRLMRLPVLALPDGGRGTLPLVYAGNVARGILACLDRPQAGGRAYNLAIDDEIDARRLIHWWCTARGLRPPRLVSIPGGPLQGAARMVDAVSGALPILRIPHLARAARLLRGPNPYDSTRARRELDWTDLVPAEQAIARTAHSLSDTDA